MGKQCESVSQSIVLDSLGTDEKTEIIYQDAVHREVNMRADFVVVRWS